MDVVDGPISAAPSRSRSSTIRDEQRRGQHLEHQRRHYPHHHPKNEERQRRGRRGRHRHRWFEFLVEESSSDESATHADADGELSSDDRIGRSPSPAPPVPSTPAAAPFCESSAESAAVPAPTKLAVLAAPPRPKESILARRRSQALSVPIPSSPSLAPLSHQAQRGDQPQQPQEAALRTLYGSVLLPRPQHDSDSEEDQRRRGRAWALTGREAIRQLGEYGERGHDGPDEVNVEGASPSSLGNWLSDYNDDAEEAEGYDVETMPLLGRGEADHRLDGRRVHWDEEALRELRRTRRLRRLRRRSRDDWDDDEGAWLHWYCMQTCILVSMLLLSLVVFVMIVLLAVWAS